MGAKIKDYGPIDLFGGQYRVLVFHCPGCGYDHPFKVLQAGINERGLPAWEWNGSFDQPTFSPSLLCNEHDPAARCHSFVRAGQIQFQSDCFHKLMGQTVDLPDYEPETEELPVTEKG